MQFAANFIQRFCGLTDASFQNIKILLEKIRYTFLRTMRLIGLIKKGAAEAAPLIADK